MARVIDLKVQFMHRVPTKRLSPIAAILLSGENRTLYFENGTSYEFTSSRLATIERFTCARAIRILSKTASPSFTRNGSYGIPVWQSILKTVEVVNFHGIWRPNVLCCLLGCMPILQYVSFTYWECSDQLQVLAAIKSTNIRELSMHVCCSSGEGYDTSKIYEVLAKWKHSLKRLCLVFEKPFDGNPIDDVVKAFFDVSAAPSSSNEPIQTFVADAEFIILFGGEADLCIKYLEQGRNEHTFKKCEDPELIKKVEAGFAPGFAYDRQISMAINELYEDGNRAKFYEEYEVYRKDEYGVLWLVSARIGVVEAKPPRTVLPDIEMVPERFEARVELGNSGSDRRMVGNVTYDGYIQSKNERDFRTNLRDYQEFKRIQPIDKCCAPVTPATSEPPSDPASETPCDSAKEKACDPATEKACGDKTSIERSIAKKWKLPGWYPTKIQKVIYHPHLTEFLTSNGFYVILEKMKDEAEFFNDMITTHHVVFLSSSSDRRYVEVENMQKFFRNTEHFEVVGTWYSLLLEHIGQRLTVKCRKLTMMRIMFHTSRPMRFFFNAIHSEIRRRLTHLHLDGRSTTCDYALGSLVNGIMFCSDKNTYNLEELILVANRPVGKPPSDQRCSLDKHLGDLLQLLHGTTPASATTILAEKVSHRDLQLLGGDRDSSGRLVPWRYIMTPVAHQFIHQLPKTQAMRGHTVERAHKNAALVKKF